MGSLRTFTYGGVMFIETGILLEVVQKYNHCLNCSQEGHSVVSCTSEKVYRLSDAMQSIVMICTLVKFFEIFVQLLFFSCFLDNFDA